MSLVDNLVAGWKLDESSGNAADVLSIVTLSNINSVTYGAGIINNGVQPRNSGKKYLSASHNSVFNFGTGDFSISFWAKLLDTSLNSTENLIRHYSGGGWVVQFKSTNRQIYFFATSTGPATSVTNAIPNDTDWHHYVFTRTGGVAKIYVDGVDKTNSGTVGTGSVNVTTPFYIGSNGTSEGFDGTVDEVYLWNRLLSGAEVLELYNSGAGKQYPFTPPPSVPEVDTLAVDDIAKYTATLNGEIIDIGSENADLRGFVYSTTSHSDPGDVAPADTDYEDYTSESGDFSEGLFDDGVTGLSAETTYYVRAWAHNEDGYSYGDEVSFETLPIVYAIIGRVTLGGTDIEGAVVRCVRQSDNVAITEQTTDSGGLYAFSDLDNTELYHLAVEYETGGSKYNAKSLWDVSPYEVE